ncbi:MAG: FliA/WhiG family RNA polymerase sigma factor [Thermodesulfobacteriota bacterium]
MKKTSVKKRVSLIAEPERESLMLENIRLVKIIAHHIAVHLPPHIDVNDLMSAGTIGLLESIDKFDASRGIKFKTYASIRIRGAIMDELRGMDWMTRSMREKSNMLKRAYGEIERRTGGPASEQDVAEFLDLSVEALRGMLSKVSAYSLIHIEDLVPDNDSKMDILECIEDPNGADPMAFARFSELQSTLATLVDSLPEKEKLIVSLYYFNELTLKEIGRVMEITESRVCQLHSQAMHRLKGRMVRSVNDDMKLI